MMSFLSLLSINQSILERLSCRSHCGNLCTLYIRSISSSPHLSHFIHNTKPLHSALFFPNDVQEFLESFSLSLCVHWKLILAPYVHCYIMHMATALVFMNISFLLFFAPPKSVTVFVIIRSFHPKTVDFKDCCFCLASPDLLPATVWKTQCSSRTSGCMDLMRTRTRTRRNKLQATWTWGWPSSWPGLWSYS